ncbi:MAG TPA: ATP-binding protein [Longimicrobiaceae bacterium]|nr:ATP-binding protein [Longimicrobiaceae bacterium]
MSQELHPEEASRTVRAATFPLTEHGTLALVLGTIADGVTVQDASGRLVYANEAAARVVGYPSAEAFVAASPQEIFSRFEILDERGAPFPLDHLPGRLVLRGEEAPEATLCWRDRRSGEERWSIVRASPVAGEGGAGRMAVNIFHDVTERMRQQRTLQDTAAKLAATVRQLDTHVREAEAARSRTAAILESIGDAFVAYDRDWRFTYVNRRAAEIFRGEGGAREDVTGMRLWDAFPEMVGSPFEEPLRRAMESGETVSFQALDRTRGRWQEVTAYPSPEGLSVYFRDITERKRAEDALSFLADASELLNRTLDPETTLADLARLAVPRLGDWCAVDLAAPDGSTRRLAVAHQDPARVEWAYELQRRYPPDPNAPIGVPQVLRTGRSELYPLITEEVLKASARDAEYLEMVRRLGLRSVMLVPLLAEGRPLGVLTLVAAESGRSFDTQDLALAEDLARRAGAAIENARLYREVEEARRLLEEQAQELEATTAELEAANEELQAMVGEAERARTEAEAANLAKSEFLALMSHELRTPLNAIAGYVELLDLGIHGPVTGEQREALRRIRFSQSHLLGIINDVLNFARLESGHVQLALSDVPVQETVAEVVAMMEPQITARGLSCEVLPGAAGVTMHVDPEKVRQILLNLLSNAVKFTPAGGVVSVNWDADGETVRIRVRDTGRGIPLGKLEAVFEPFVQVDPGLTRETGGAGLGLAISRDLARAMRGDLLAESVLGEGSTFTLVLPRRGAAPGPSATPPARER